MVNNIGFKVNPNPVQNTMHLYFDEMTKPEDRIGKDVVIRDLAGKTVTTLQLPSTDNISTATLDVSSLKTGMYMLSLMVDGKAINQKFLKQ